MDLLTGFIVEQQVSVLTFLPADVPALIPAYAGPQLTTTPLMVEVPDKGKGRAQTPDPFIQSAITYPPGSFPPLPTGPSGSLGGNGINGSEEVVD
jgi:hypothetical protein